MFLSAICTFSDIAEYAGFESENFLRYDRNATDEPY